MAICEAVSRLPLYFFWIFCISGWTSCMPRIALIWRNSNGISRMRIVMVRPTIDSTQARPGPSGRPTMVRRVWIPVMIHATTTSIGYSRSINSP